MTQARVIEVKRDAKENDAFRRVVFTAGRTQLVLMALRPGEDIGDEVHDDVDQLLYAVKGEGTALIDGVAQPFAKGAVLCVPAGTRHNVTNTGGEPMKLFTVYAPPQHADGTVHETKADAKAAGSGEAAHA